MIEDYEQNNFTTLDENNRYINKEREYPFQREGNNLNYSSNTNLNDYNSNYYSNNFNSNSNIINYNNKYNFINEEYSQNSITEQIEESKNIGNNQSQTIDALSNKYFSKVVVENIRRTKDIEYILENFLKENNYPKTYQMKLERNKISFNFYEEEIAFKFTKLLNSYKNRNSLYMEMNVHLSLTPNNNYNKKDKKKRRGLSIDSIQRLFNGLGSKKREKKNKINLNLDLGVSSPFYQHKKGKSPKNNNNKNSFSKEKLKDYNKLPIRVLDTDYKPLRDHIYRTDVKEK